MTQELEKFIKEIVEEETKELKKENANLRVSVESTRCAGIELVER